MSVSERTRQCPVEGRPTSLKRSVMRRRPSSLGLANQLARVAWGIVWRTLFRPTPPPLHAWRRLILRLFGAKMGEGAVVYPSARIWAPWNLQMGSCACIGPHVDCYSVATISIGAHATVSQYSYLCSASHDIDSLDMGLTTAPINIGDQAWVAADAFIGPGVTVGQGAVVGARASVFRDVPPWIVVGGNPARLIRMRKRTT